MHTFPIINILQSGTLVTIDKPWHIMTQSSQFTLVFTLGMVHSMTSGKYIIACIFHPYGKMQITFIVLKIFVFHSFISTPQPPMTILVFKKVNIMSTSYSSYVYKKSRSSGTLSVEVMSCWWPIWHCSSRELNVFTGKFYMIAKMSIYRQKHL